MESKGKTLAALLGVIALLVGVALVSASVSRLISGAAIVFAGILVIGVLLAAVGVRAADWDPVSEEEFDQIVQRSERLAAQGVAADPEEEDFLVQDPMSDEDFEEIVGEALDDLPDLLKGALRNLAVVVTDGGLKADAYGLYEGDTIAGGHFASRVLIFRDSLRRDFGHDADLLREEITITVRHELAHHLGADELGVRDLGLD